MRLYERLRIAREVEDRLQRLDVPFNDRGFDRYGVSRQHLRKAFTLLGIAYRHYFQVRCFGTENIPKARRAMLVANHAGGYAVDAGMLLAACFFDLDPPRLAQGMAEKFINRWPFASEWAARTGQITGLPEHASRLLKDERLLMVFPEGARGTAKLFRDRHTLTTFGSGFARLALETQSPVIPVAVLGAGDALPTIANLKRLGALFRAPYVPVTPYLLPIPLPVRIELHIGKAINLEGSGNEEDEVLNIQIERVRSAISQMIARGRQAYPS